MKHAESERDNKSDYFTYTFSTEGAMNLDKTQKQKINNENKTNDCTLIHSHSHNCIHSQRKTKTK